MTGMVTASMMASIMAGSAILGHASHLSDVRRNGMQCHHSHSPGLLCDHRLLWSGDVHDDTTLLHLCETAL